MRKFKGLTEGTEVWAINVDGERVSGEVLEEIDGGYTFQPHNFDDTTDFINYEDIVVLYHKSYWMGTMPLSKDYRDLLVNPVYCDESGFTTPLSTCLQELGQLSYDIGNNGGCNLFDWDEERTLETCSHCDGDGYVETGMGESECHICEGYGEVEDIIVSPKIMSGKWERHMMILEENLPKELLPTLAKFKAEVEEEEWESDERGSSAHLEPLITGVIEAKKATGK